MDLPWPQQAIQVSGGPQGGLGRCRAADGLWGASKG